MIRRILFASVFYALGPVAGAGVIGVNFAGGDGATGPFNLATGEVAGAVAQDHWNNADGNVGTLFNLTDNTGANTGALISWESPNTWSSGSGSSPSNGNDLLMGGYLDSSGNEKEPNIAVSFIPYAVYDVYVYIATDAPFSGRDAFYTVNGVTQYIANYGYDGSLIEGDNGNYLVFHGVTGSSLEIIGNGNLTFRSPIAGIQIVQVVPEPASVILLGLGVIPALVLAVRRRRA